MSKPQRYGASAAPRDDGCFVMYAEYEKVVAERDALRADAERYRFLTARAELRQCDWSSYWYIKTVDVPSSEPLRCSLDRVIDLARAKEVA